MTRLELLNQIVDLVDRQGEDTTQLVQSLLPQVKREEDAVFLDDLCNRIAIIFQGLVALYADLEAGHNINSSLEKLDIPEDATIH